MRRQDPFPNSALPSRTAGALAAMLVCVLIGAAPLGASGERHGHHPHGYHLLPDRPGADHHKGHDPHYPYLGKKKKKKKKPARSVTVDGRGDKKKGTVKTIGEALKKVAAGGTIVIRPRPFGRGDYDAGASGAYRETLVITKPVSLIGALGQVQDHSSRVLIEPQTGQPCVVVKTNGTVFLRSIDWAVPDGQNTGGAPCIDIQQGRAVIEDIYVAGRIDGAGIRIASDTVILRQNEIALTGIGILVELAHIGARRRTSLVRSYVIEDNTVYKTRVGLEVRGPHPLEGGIGQPDLRIAENQFIKNKRAGVLLRQLEDVDLIANVIQANGADGLILDNAGGRVAGNTIRGNGKAGVRLSASNFAASFSDNRINQNTCGITLEKEGFAVFSNDSLANNQVCYCPHKRRSRKAIGLDRHACHR